MKIGDTIEINGVTVRVDREKLGCVGCHFYGSGKCELEITTSKHLTKHCGIMWTIFTKVETSPENTSGLTDHELKLEKIVDKIRAANTTIEAICVLKDSINEIIM